MDEELRDIARLFAAYPRPSIFTNVEHCSECAEHHEELAPYSRETIQRQHLGHAGWDPITFCTDEAFLYFFPALARITAQGKGDDYYVTQFLSHVSWRRELFSPEQRLAVVAFLLEVGVTLADEIERNLDAYDLENVLEALVV